MLLYPILPREESQVTRPPKSLGFFDFLGDWKERRAGFVGFKDRALSSGDLGYLLDLSPPLQTKGCTAMYPSPPCQMPYHPPTAIRPTGIFQNCVLIQDTCTRTHIWYTLMYQRYQIKRHECIFFYAILPDDLGII